MGGGIKIPDWKIYQLNEPLHPAVKKYMEKLEEHGLKDPWLRNELWRFQTPKGSMYNPVMNLVKTYGRGFLLAGAIVLPYCLYTTFTKSKEPAGHHH